MPASPRMGAAFPGQESTCLGKKPYSLCRTRLWLLAVSALLCGCCLLCGCGPAPGGECPSLPILRFKDAVPLNEYTSRSADSEPFDKSSASQRAKESANNSAIADSTDCNELGDESGSNCSNETANVSNDSIHTRPLGTTFGLWQTSCDQEKLLTKIVDGKWVAGNSSVSLADAGGWAHINVSINLSQVSQTMVGFGGTLTASSAYVLRQAPQAVREAAMTKLFGTLEEGGIRLNFIRMAIGASDFSLPRGIALPTYDELVGDLADCDLAQFSVEGTAHDVDVEPLILRLQSRNQDITLMATPWTASRWMKTDGQSDHSNGRGTLKDTSYEVYAHYLAMYLLDKRAKGINITYLSLQNEPAHGFCGIEMPCMPMKPEEQTKLGLIFESYRIKYAIDIAILAYDHNWSASWGQWLSGVGFSLLQIFPTWVLYLFLGLSIGIFIQRCKPLNEAAGKLMRRSRHVAKATGIIKSPQSRRRRHSNPENLKSPLVESYSAPVELNAAIDIDMGSPASGMGRQASSASDRSNETRNTMVRIGSQVALTYTQLASDDDPKARWGRRFVYTITSILLAGRCVGLIAGMFTSRWGFFDPSMGKDYPDKVLSSPGADLVFKGVAWHCYGGHPSAMGTLYNKFPQTEHHVTECSGFVGDKFEHAIIAEANWIFDAVARNRASSILRMNFALNESNGPVCGRGEATDHGAMHWLLEGEGGACCTNCRPLVTIPSTAKTIHDLTFNHDYYQLAHHSAFVKKGAKVINAATAWSDDISKFSPDAVAYKNPDGDLVVVILNRSPENVTTAVEDPRTNSTFQFLAPCGLSTVTLSLSNPETDP